MDEARRETIEARVVARARAFEPGALMRVLGWLGYEREAVALESSTDLGPRRSLIEAVRFETAPRRAVVTVNLGLARHDGLLPEYVLELQEQLPDPGPLQGFLQFFDHVLLFDYLAALDDSGVFAGPTAARRDASFALLGLESVSTLTWLFGLVFPELGVHVRRADVRARTDAHALVLGAGRLDGRRVLGTTYDAGRPGFEVELFAEDERDARGRGWWQVARKRLEAQVLAHFADARSALTVTLVIVEHETWARLHRGGQLGYDRIEGSPADHRILVHREPAA